MTTYRIHPEDTERMPSGVLLTTVAFVLYARHSHEHRFIQGVNG